MDGAIERRPVGVTVLAVFSVVAAIISFTSALSLLWPGGPLEPMWRINPRAREGFGAMGPWAPVMLAGVCIGCALSAVGLWRGRRWGYRLAIAGLVVNVVGDATNAVVRHDLRSAIGIPIVVGLIAYLLTDSVRRFFRRPSR